MDIQESINNQQENTGQVSTLRQRRNTNNAITQRLPSSAEIFSSITKQSPISRERIQSTPTVNSCCQPVQKDVPMRLLSEKDGHSTSSHIIRPDAIRYSMLLQGIAADSENPTKPIIYAVDDEEFTNDELNFIAELLNFIAQYRQHRQTLPPKNAIEECIIQKTQNFEAISFRSTILLIEHLEILLTVNIFTNVEKSICRAIDASLKKQNIPYSWASYKVKEINREADREIEKMRQRDELNKQYYGQLSENQQAELLMQDLQYQKNQLLNALKAAIS
jgi:hypothetical protein